MGSAILFTAAHMQEIEDATVTSMAVNGAGHLIVTRHDSSTFDAGDVSTWLPGRLKAANTIGASADPDAYTDSGWYAGSSWINSLSGHAFGVLEVLTYDATHISQNFWTIEATPRRFKRARFGASWTAWVQQDAYSSSAEAITGTALDRAVTPKALADLWADASKAGNTTTRGLLKLALDAAALTGTATDTAVTPASLTYIRDQGMFDTRYYTETEINAFLAAGKIGLKPIAPSSVVIGLGTSASVGSDGIVTLNSIYNLSLVGLLTGRKRVKLFITLPTVTGAAGYLYLRWMSGTTPDVSNLYYGGMSGRQVATWVQINTNPSNFSYLGYTSLVSGRSGNFYEIDIDLTGAAPIFHARSSYAAASHTSLTGSTMFDANLVPDGIYLTGDSTSTRWSGTLEAYEYVR